ncbi:MAG: CDGSH iron-sulfur domain-containing protein [Acidobacteria bacterium]|nr:CDGSH iron-sulfur domain-containing protein [Acidobacteriota bacterium]MBI3657264.1 CDGSH iron-sulfur domain-containing protein [Acidobacteriota bacterium]
MSDPADIVCNNNGPLRVSGNFVIKDAAGNAFDVSGRAVIALCRCGHSANKPFCDGSHNKAGFQSVVAACKLPPPAPKP